MPAQDLYEKDFFQWTIRNAELLRAGRFEEADMERIAEELEDMGIRERHELASRLCVLVTHLLKWQVQTERRSSSWKGTMNTQRAEIADRLSEMPSLCHELRQRLPRVYSRAVGKAASETGLPPTMFPSECPYSLDQILDAEFLPE